MKDSVPLKPRPPFQYCDITFRYCDRNVIEVSSESMQFLKTYDCSTPAKNGRGEALADIIGLYQDYFENAVVVAGRNRPHSIGAITWAVEPCQHANVDEYFGKCDDCGAEVQTVAPCPDSHINDYGLCIEGCNEKRR